MKCLVLCAALLQLLTLTVNADPLVGPRVTLSHGGQYEGKSIKFNGIDVDIFQGIRYAKPPVGDLRFKKPDYPEPWSGVESVKERGNMCSQSNWREPSSIIGAEDCLFMDITVPGGIDVNSSKAVMIWIHGGGYTIGTGSSYLGAPIAVNGDVIVVTFNYRLGIMGFLTDGEGTGNFGLWDMRQAMLWVQMNIDRFGGDNKRVTIFGESAGAGGVSAQIMGQHNKDLFQRAIQQSGSLFTSWGWYVSEKTYHEARQFLRNKAGCSSTMGIYDCLKDMPVEEIEKYRSEYDLTSYLLIWHPYPDNDFFSPDVMHDNYTFQIDVDLIAGFNGQEGGVELIPLMAKMAKEEGKAITGFTNEMSRNLMRTLCKTATPMSINLCVDFYMNTYNITNAPDDQERGVRLSYAFGEISFNTDSVRQLRAHSQSDKSTYAYYFTNLYHAPPQSGWWDNPDWLKKSADHADEIAFVWGALLTEGSYSSFAKAYGDENATYSLADMFDLYPAEFAPLSKIMVTKWTNFAKSGDPNRPISASIPWPSFTKDNEIFMEFNSKGDKEITTPHKDRLDKVLTTIFSARKQQVAADKAPVVVVCGGQTTPSQKATVPGGKDAVIG